MKNLNRFCITLGLSLLLPLQTAAYDLVVEGGRVMDPESGLDAIRNIGIRDGKIAKISRSKLRGDRIIDAEGLVVAPGFIDTHMHGQDPFAVKMALRDGVTSGLDLEAGAYQVDDWYAAKAGNWQINYGVSASHVLNRIKIMDAEVDMDGPKDQTKSNNLLNAAAADGEASWSTQRANTEQLNAIVRRIDEELKEGALGVGLALAYMARGATSYEIFAVQQVTARYGRPAAVHTRYHMGAKPPTEAGIGFDEVFTNAMLLDAPLLLVHNNDYGWEENEEKLQLARAKGLNMWSEHYPYDAGSTFVGADFLRPDIWEKEHGFRYEDTLYHPETDRFLNRKQYDALVAENPGSIIVVFMPPRKNWLEHWLRMPHMTVGSDGMQGLGKDGKLLSWDADYSEFAGHPRTSASHAKTLRLAREAGVPLMHTLSQLSYWSAKHLGDAGLKAMQLRGRIQKGMIADLTLFDAEKVRDNADYKAGTNGLPSTGIPWVIVNGEVVVENSRVLKAVKAGQPIRYTPVKEGQYQPITARDWMEKHSIQGTALKKEPVVSHLH